MDLASYAELVVQLVNTDGSDEDRLRDLDALHDLLTIRPHLGGRVGHPELADMRELRTELRAIFEAVDDADEDTAMDRLNALLIQHPVHPQVSGHDGQRWHLHITEGGSVPDRYAAGAAMGLAVFVSDFGIDRLGICRRPDCRNVLFNTGAAPGYCTLHGVEPGNGEGQGQ
jgi:Putative stress-induced transcription regulator